ncbi:MAG TPA: endonuclease/exonuclease/phosphatase family protein [Candidatus Methylomirabilis sp.]|nr:endonuclease/exonuclease/phosphatase family protein [Candidatus Methylomirabilis sp.]
MIHLGTWLVLAAALPIASGGQAAGSAPPLKFVTFNLFHGGVFSGLSGDAKDLERRLEMAADALGSLRVDVIGLQEASASRGRGNVAERLANQLGFHYVYAPASSRFFGDNGFDRVIASVLNFTEGPAIVSRFPIIRWEVHDLPRCGRLFDSRVLLAVTLQTPWGPLRVFSTHTRGDPCQTQRVAALARNGHGPLPAVLLGDFNAAEGSDAITALTGDTGFVDAYRTANPTLPGPTVWQRIEEPVPTVWRRVDYVFVIPGTEFPGTVISSRVILDAPRQLPDGKVLWPSDHYGVLAEMEMFPSPPGRS